MGPDVEDFTHDKNAANRTTNNCQQNKPNAVNQVLPLCPFCGGVVHLHTGHAGMTFFTCGQRDNGSDGCGAVVSFRPDLRGNAARTAWRKRAECPF